MPEEGLRFWPIRSPAVPCTTIRLPGFLPFTASKTFAGSCWLGLPTCSTDCWRGVEPLAEGAAQVPPSSLSLPHFSTVQSSRTTSEASIAVPVPSETVFVRVLWDGLPSLGTEISGFSPTFPLTWATPAAASPLLSPSEPHDAVDNRAGTASGARREARRGGTGNPGRARSLGVVVHQSAGGGGGGQWPPLYDLHAPR